MGKINRIEINFPCAVDFPDGFEKVLNSLIDMACQKYLKENPDRVMWPAGYGSKLHWSGGEIAGTEDDVYCIDVCEREDYYGNNENNPNGKELRMKADEIRKKTSDERMKRRVEKHIEDQKKGEEEISDGG